MSKIQKKNLILSKIEEGDRRSYNELAADLELLVWTMRNQGYIAQPKDFKTQLP